MVPSVGADDKGVLEGDHEDASATALPGLGRSPLKAHYAPFGPASGPSRFRDIDRMVCSDLIGARKQARVLLSG